MFPLRKEKKKKKRRFTEIFAVKRANTQRLKKSSIRYMQKLLTANIWKIYFKKHMQIIHHVPTVPVNFELWKTASCLPAFWSCATTITVY